MYAKRLGTALPFIAPWLAGFLALTAYPFLMSLYWSFCKYDLLNPPKWVGGRNYARLGRELAAGTEFGQALSNTLYYAAVSIPGSVVLGIGLALALNVRVPGRTVFRILLFLPTIVPTVAVSIVWLLLLDPHSGLINRLIHGWGTSPAWFNSSARIVDPAGWSSGKAGLGALDALILMTWWGVGNYMVIYLASLRNIPRELYEAAELDGAGPLRRFWSITLPLLTPVIFFNVVMGIVNSVQFFTQPYVVSGGTGAPEGATRLLALHVFLWGFKYLDAGYASAAAWLLFALVALLTVALFRTSSRWVYYGH